MSTCNCDGTISTTLTEKLFGDSVLSSLGITEAQLDPLLGGADPRPLACQQAVATLQATGQDPCNLDSPGDLDVLYKGNLPGVWASIQGTAVSNPLQKAFDVAAGTATPQTPVTGSQPPKSSTNYVFIVGAILILAVGFILVFR